MNIQLTIGSLLLAILAAAAYSMRPKKKLIPVRTKRRDPRTRK